MTDTQDLAGPGGRVNPVLERGRKASDERAWYAAYRALSDAARTAPLAAEDVERLAWAAGLSGHLDDYFAAMERLHHLHVQGGEPKRAARAAFWIGFRLLGLGETARGTGWLGRAERLVEPDVESAEQGYLLLPVAQRHFLANELEAAYEVAARAVVIGERFGDRDLAEFARGIQGRALVRQGRLREGLARLDEVMVAATSDELSTVFTGLLYCMVIECCRTVYALDRAQEWTQALAQWCEVQPQLAPFTGECRVRRAEILALRGEWAEAIAEADRAAETFGRTEPTGAGEAIYQRAELHRL